MARYFLKQSGADHFALQSGGGALLEQAQPILALSGLQPLMRGTHNGRGGMQQVQDGISQFAQVAPTVADFFLLLESGDKLLLESGDDILLEQ